MKIAIIGASHGIGSELLKAAIEEGHEVTALVRDPAKLNTSIPGLNVIENLSGVTAGKISRADVADFILKQLASPTCFGKTPLLMY